MLLESVLVSIFALGSVELQACYVAGSEKAVECTLLDVPKTYQDETDQKAQLHVIKHRAWSNTNKPPVFVLAGGPGQAATEMTHMLNTAFKEVKKQHDIIFVAQRGSGLSNAQRCETPETNDSSELVRALADCRSRIVAVEDQLSTDTLARDIEQVRESLGYASIHLWGGSYGTFAAQHYANLFPDAAQSLMLDAVVSLDANPLIAGNRYPQQSLERLDAICQQDPYCSARFPQWKQDLEKLLAQSELSPITVMHDNKETQLGHDAIAQIIRTALYSPEWAAQLPLAVDNALKGDNRILASINNTIVSSFGPSMYVGLTMGVLCQEHVYDGQQESATEAGKNTFVGDSYYTFWMEACGGERPIQAKYVDTPESLSMPTLLISGDLDPITPEQSANQTLTYLSNVQHIIIPNASHTNSGRGCMPRLLSEFLIDGKVKDVSCITSNQFPPFML